MEASLIIVILLFAQIIPLDDPVYEAIDRLESKGILEIYTDTKPYILNRDCRWNLPDDLNEHFISDSDIFDIMLIDLPINLTLPTVNPRWAPVLEVSDRGGEFALGGAVRTSYRMPDTLRAGPEIRYYGTIGHASFFVTHRFTYAANWPDTVFDAKSWRGDERPVFAEIPDARVDFDFDWLHVQAGRSQMQFGPVPDGGLFLSTQPWGLDHASYTLKWKGVRFTTMYSWLQSDKRMVVHRFEYVAPRWKLGLSEAVVARDTNDIFPYLAAPVAFYYFMQWNKRQDENVLWGVDAAIFLSPFKIYAEFLVDDFAYEPATGPHKIGGTVGSEWVSAFSSEVDVLADYTAISKWTYSQRDSVQNYTFRGRILGDDLGPDADRVRLTATWRIIPRLTLRLKCYCERHGEGDVWRDFADDGAYDRETFHPPFPSGVVERRLGVEGTIRMALVGRSYLSLRGGVQSLTNTGHNPGEDELIPLFQTDIYWEF